MAAMFFQGTLGSAITYSVFQGAGGRPGPQGQPPGMTATPLQRGGQESGNQVATNYGARLSGQQQRVQNEAVKKFS